MERGRGSLDIARQHAVDTEQEAYAPQCPLGLCCIINIPAYFQRYVRIPVVVHKSAFARGAPNIPERRNRSPSKAIEKNPYAPKSSPINHQSVILPTIQTEPRVSSTSSYTNRSHMSGRKPAGTRVRGTRTDIPCWAVLLRISRVSQEVVSHCPVTHLRSRGGVDDSSQLLYA